MNLFTDALEQSNSNHSILLIFTYIHTIISFSIASVHLSDLILYNNAKRSFTTNPRYWVTDPVPWVYY